MMGVAAGVVSGLLGVGGGILFVPTLTLVLSLSQVQAEATSLLAIILAALAVLDRVGATRAVVVGHSLGGAVAAWLAATHPDRVASLVLIAPSANTESLVPLDRVLAAPLIGEILSAASLAGAGAALAA